MWYVVQTKSGDEQKIIAALQRVLSEGSFGECFTPLFEDVRRTKDQTKITFKRLFPEYLFIETDQPELVSQALRSIPNFSRVLGSYDDEGNKIFIPVEKEDELFIRSLLFDGVLRVSYVTLSKNNRVLDIYGPLARYRNHITRLEIRHRMAIVEMEVFGKRRRIKFGLWTKDDPRLPMFENLEEFSGDQKALFSDGSSDIGEEVDIGIHPGDIVIDETGVYGDMEFTVDSVDTRYRRVYTTIFMGITAARLELSADQVRVVERA